MSQHILLANFLSFQLTHLTFAEYGTIFSLDTSFESFRFATICTSVRESIENSNDVIWSQRHLISCFSREGDSRHCSDHNSPVNQTKLKFLLQCEC